MSQARGRYERARDETITPDMMRAHWIRYNAAFEAGAQYALDQLLVLLGRMTVGPMEFEHMTAADILEQVRTRGPL